MADLERDPEFAAAMLREGVNALLADETNVAKAILRDYINATIGFEVLSRKVDIPPKSLMRMLSPAGNPQASNLLTVVSALQRYAGVEFQVTDVLATKAMQLESAERAREQGKRDRDPPGNQVRYAERTYEARMDFEEEAGKFGNPRIGKKSRMAKGSS